MSVATVAEYDVSPDGKEVLFATEPPGSGWHLWRAPIDRHAAPTPIGIGGETSPWFGRDGRILFRFTQNHVNYLGQMNRDGSARGKVVPYPISTLIRINPDRRWLAAIVPQWNGSGTPRTVAIPTGGGPPRAICTVTCWPTWSPDGSLLYLSATTRSSTNPGRTIAMPVNTSGLPDLPPDGLVVPGAVASAVVSIEHADVIPGPNPSTYAYIKTNTSRNLFQIRVQ